MKLYYYGWQQADASGVMQINGVQIVSDFYKTEAEAQELHSLFSKGCKLRCGGIQGTFDDTPDELRWIDKRYCVSLGVSLWSNGVNGGVNETGINRLKRIKREADVQGVEIVYRPCGIGNTVEIEWFK